MNEVEDSCVNIFYKEKRFFANLNVNIKLSVFPKLKLYEESPRIMVNKCAVKNSSTSYKTGQKKALFHFPEYQELKQKWIFLKYQIMVESWSKCPYFTLTKQTSHALITKLRGTSSLIRYLPAEGYNYVLTAKFQSDSLETHFNKYIQISGRRFLVSSREVTNLEKILKISSVLNILAFFGVKMCT